MKEEINYSFTYPGVLKIERFGQEPIHLNYENLKDAINRVRRNKNEYATNESYELHLKLFQDGMNYFMENAKFRFVWFDGNTDWKPMRNYPNGNFEKYFEYMSAISDAYISVEFSS